MLKTNADLFLDIARRHLKRLSTLRGPVTIGSKPSLHMRHAVICSVFSAFAVEHALTELIWARCFFQIPAPYRAIALDYARSLRTMDARLRFLRVATQVPDDLVQDLKRLFNYRNKIAHARIRPFEGTMLFFEPPEEELEIGQGRVYGADEVEKFTVAKDVRHLDLEGIGTPDVDIAPENFLIAETALKAFRSEMQSTEWPIFGPQRSRGE